MAQRCSSIYYLPFNGHIHIYTTYFTYLLYRQAMIVISMTTLVSTVCVYSSLQLFSSVQLSIGLETNEIYHAQNNQAVDYRRIRFLDQSAPESSKGQYYNQK